MKTNSIFYSKFGTYTYIYTIPITEFIEQKPPCVECLIQSMCINNIPDIRLIHQEVYDKDISYDIRIKPCDKLDKFLKKNKNFKQIGLTNARK